MFIENHLLDDKATDADQLMLYFVKSDAVQVFPCGRRRSKKDNGDSFIPFDPESRLNTEANNVRHSSINSFTQTYLNKLDSEKKYLSIVLAGYLFNIRFDYDDVNTTLEQKLGEIVSTSGKVYVNVILAKVPLFSSDALNYNTFVLRDQVANISPSTCLDLLKTSGTDTDGNEIILDHDNVENYYFSGLSFSAEPITARLDTTQAPATRNTVDFMANDIQQQAISLCILERKNESWCIHYPALLPKVEHGNTENSVKLQDVYVNKLKQTVNTDAGSVLMSMPAAKLAQTPDNAYQLQFFNVELPS